MSHPTNGAFYLSAKAVLKIHRMFIVYTSGAWYSIFRQCIQKAQESRSAYEFNIFSQQLFVLRI